MIFPDDADGHALRALAIRTDITKPMEIDFVVIAPNEGTAKLIAMRVIEFGYVSAVGYDEESAEWVCYCSKLMIPTYEAIVDAQEELGKISRELDGYTDGWGTFGTQA